MRSAHQFKVRLPDDLMAFVADQSERYGSSQNSEIVRAVRERMERTKAVAGDSFQAVPATVTHDTALQGGPEAQAVRMPG